MGDMEVEKSEVKNKTVGEYMKLGIICTMINGFGRRGYYNTQEIGLGRELERQGHEVTIYKCVKKTDGESIERVKLGNTLSILYIPVSSFGAHGCLDTAVLSTDLDAVLCFADNQIFLPHIYRFCARHEIRMVPYIGRTHSSSGGVHGFAMNTLFHLGTLRWFRRGPAISKIEEVRQELLQLGVKDVKVAPVGLDFSVMKSDFAAYDRAALRREFGLLPEDMVICTVGRMGPEKNPLDLVEIYQQVREQKPCKLLLVGEGTQSEDLKTKIAASKWKSDIVLIDRIPNDQIWKVYATADYFVNLCRTEIFGMAILEAMYYGVSVAALAAPGPSVTLRDMPGHKLCSSYEEIRDWLLAEHPAQEQLRESAARTVQLYNWKPCADTFLSMAVGGTNEHPGHHNILSSSRA